MLHGSERAAADALSKRALASMVAIGLSPGWLTGVAVRFTDRFFAVSASHGVERIVGIDQVHLLAQGRIASRDGGGVIATGYFRGSESYDIGILELEPGFAAALEVQWIEESMMHSHELKDDSDIFVVGFPVARATPPADDDYPTILRPYGMFTKVREEVPAGVRAQLINDLDLVAPIPDEDIDGGHAIESDDPRGLKGVSGGPVFSFPFLRDSGLWTPSDAPLAGIQVGVFPDSRLLKFQRIEFALECLRNFDTRKEP